MEMKIKAHIAGIGDLRNVHRILIVTPKEKRQFERTKRKYVEV
jgi:hypothetical protein